MSDEDIPSLCNENDAKNCSSDDEEEWLEYDDTNDCEEKILCLFCTCKYNNVELAIKHISDDHSIDFIALKAKFDMDQYGFIKMINYIRTHDTIPDRIRLTNECLWNDEKYLKPVILEEWLMFDYEGLGTEEKKVMVKSEKEKIRELMEIITIKDDLLQQATASIDMLRNSVQRILEEQSDEIKIKKEQNLVSTLQDNGYFQTYSHFGIHYDMLSDDVRTSSYSDAILKNNQLLQDKIVLDLGCGTAILSMLSSKAGAKKVISVDESDIIYHAMDIARNNNFTNIEFVKGRLEDITLSVDKVDIIVSEWMGYFLLFEGMLDSVIYARNNNLVSNGTLIPNRCIMYIVGYGDEKRHQNFISFWNNVYGFDMSCLQNEVLKEASVEICDAENVLTEPFTVADLDLMTIDLNYSNFTCKFMLNVLRGGKLTSLVGYFDTFFELMHPVKFSTSPHAKPTHWKQTVFYFKNVLEVTAGDVIEGTFKCRRDPKDPRSLVITIDLKGMSMKYNLN